MSYMSIIRSNDEDADQNQKETYTIQREPIYLTNRKNFLHDYDIMGEISNWPLNPETSYISRWDLSRPSKSVI